MQGKKFLLAVISGIAAIFAGTQAQASVFEMSYPNGWYVEANAGSVHLSNTSSVFPAGTSTSSSGIGGNANLGYKFMPYAALEIGYSQYPNTKINAEDGTRIATAKHYSYDIAAKGIIPVSDSGFEVFAKLGAQHIQLNISNDDPSYDVSGSHASTGVYMGAGGQLNIMPELGVVAQWQRAQGNSSSGTEDLFSIGLVLMFV